MNSVIFIVGPDRTIHRLDNLSDAANLQLTPFMEDLYVEMCDVQRIRKKLQHALFTGKELRADMVSKYPRSKCQVLLSRPQDAESVRQAVLQLETRGRLQYATLRASNIVNVLRRLMRTDIPWNEESHTKSRVHRLIVKHKDADADKFLTAMDYSSPEPSSSTPSGNPRDSTPIVMPLPETLPATFNLLLKWFSNLGPHPTGTKADDRDEFADLTIVDLAQLYLLAVKLRISTLVSSVADSLLALKVDTTTMKDLLDYINSETAPNSDLRQFLVTAVARCGTSDAITAALNEGWMTNDIWSEVTLAFVRERDGMLRKWDEHLGLEKVEEGKWVRAEEKGGRAARSKKRGAGGDAETPTGKRRKI